MVLACTNNFIKSFYWTRNNEKCGAWFLERGFPSQLWQFFAILPFFTILLVPRYPHDSPGPCWLTSHLSNRDWSTESIHPSTVCITSSMCAVSTCLVAELASILQIHRCPQFWGGVSIYFCMNYSCSCYESPFRYDSMGYVVTGNLSIVENRKLRKLHSKGPSYREQNIKWQTNLKILKKAVREYKLKWAKKGKSRC